MNSYLGCSTCLLTWPKAALQFSLGIIGLIEAGSVAEVPMTTSPMPPRQLGPKASSLTSRAPNAAGRYWQSEPAADQSSVTAGPLGRPKSDRPNRAPPGRLTRLSTDR